MKCIVCGKETELQPVIRCYKNKVDVIICDSCYESDDTTEEEIEALVDNEDYLWRDDT